MILYNNKHFVARSDHPNDDWVGNADHIIPDGSELAEKILRLYPNFEIVTDGSDNLIDVSETEPAPVPPLRQLTTKGLKRLKRRLRGSRQRW